MPLPITQLGSWEAGLLEGVVGATAEGEMAEAHQLAADLESFGFSRGVGAGQRRAHRRRVRVRPAAVAAGRQDRSAGSSPSCRW